MLVPHASFQRPIFQHLAHMLMSRLPPTQATPEAQPREAEAQQFAGVAPEHWGLLFGAVTERLRLSMDALEAAMADVPGTSPAITTTRVGVLECVEALTQLGATICDAIGAKRP